MRRTGFLRPDVVIEPLWASWHAWTYLVPPLTAGSFVRHRLIPLLESFIADPAPHARSLEQGALGGPFVMLPATSAPALAAYLASLREAVRPLIELAHAWESLDRLLESRARGWSLEPLYAEVPAALRGLVELVYDRRGVPAAKPIEDLIYDAYPTDALQELALARSAARDRAFAFSTPRLPRPGQLRVRAPFRSDLVDALAAARLRATHVDELADRLALTAADRSLFHGWFDEAPPARPAAHDGDGVRIKYFGHACVLLESRHSAVLVDPWLGYAEDLPHPQLGLADLPDRIDLALITHGHADHFMLETLLQLRHRIGTVVVPRSGWSMLDPSLGTLLRRCGFPSVRELDSMEELPLADGGALALPFLGEHADLAIRAKATYLVRLGGSSIFFAADANNLEPELYRRAARRIGGVDVIFLGMECVGAPLGWLYGDLLARPVTAEQASSRRLDGSNAAKGIELIDSLTPSTAVFVYALGHEPWLEWLSAVRYTEASPPIVESNRLIDACRGRDLHAERLFCARELTVG